MDTIAAISTAAGAGGIGIIRLSGDDCFKVLDKIFVPKNKKEIKGYSIKYGNIIDSKTDEIIDEVLVSYFINPKSYTKENMCEINSHGGYAVEKKILEECLKNGARLADPGEFTKRAFINGRIDLAQAEAVMDLINASTECERKASIKQLKGSISKRIKEIKDLLLNMMADIEASIDYPEYDVEEVTNQKLLKALGEVKQKLEILRNSYENGKIIKEGIRTAIIGKPNVGKSSLLNLMLNEERAIVSNIEGTTRDTIEENINIEGIELKIIDTAGIRKTDNEVEQIGVKKTIKVINDADLVILVLDDSRELDDEDKKIIELLKNKKAIILLNKVDLNKKNINREKIKNWGNRIVEISTLTGYGLEKLYNEIIEMFKIKEIEINSGETITNIRQKEDIDNALEAVNDANQAILSNMPIDICSIYIKEILENLGKITGDNISDDIIKTIFSKFCLGK